MLQIMKKTNVFGAVQNSASSSSRISNFTKRFAVLTLLLLTFVLGTRAASYVFYYNGNYMYVNNGSIASTSTFSTACIWEGGDGEKFSNNGFYLVGNNNNNTLSLAKNQNQGTSWTINGNNLYFHSRTQSRVNYYYRGVIYNNGAWGTVESDGVFLGLTPPSFEGNVAVLYQVNLTPYSTSTESVITPATSTITLTPSTAELNLGEQEIFTASASNITQVVYNTPEYTAYSFNNITHYYYGGTMNTVKPAAIEQSRRVLSPVFNWDLTGTGASCIASTPNEASNTLKVTSNPSADQTATLSVKAVYGDNVYATPNASATITVKRKLDNPTSITAEDLELEVGKQASISYTLKPLTAYNEVIYSGYDNTIISVDATGVVTAKKAGKTSVTLTAKNQDGTDGATTTLSISVLDRCATPIIEINRNTGSTTISCTTNGVAIYYTTDGSNPTKSSSKYNGPFTVGNGVIVKAIAVKDGWLDSNIGMASSGGSGENASDPYYISSVEGLNYMAEHPTYHFKVVADFNASGFTNSITNFSGTLDGDYKVISGLSRPLFTSTNGATIKNVVLDAVSLTSSVTTNSTTCLGAIAAYASGNTKIYNCGILSRDGISSVSGGNNTGSLVGYITGNTRVVNNYSYANVSGGQYVGGIVGRVAGNALSNARYANNDHCAVTNNMFYGDLSGTSNVSPVYAGNHTSNDRNTNEYNFWRSKANVGYNNYNNQLAVDKDEYLNRFPFYRHIQNTHRELAAIYLFGSRTDANVAEIGHWYNVKNDEKVLYPVIEKWQTNTKRTTVDIAANLPTTTDKFAGKLLSNISADGYYTGTGQLVTTMGNAGYLTVNVSINGRSYTSQLPITDMDTLNYDFTWGKVVLPFANEYEGWTRDYSKICTGWKITSITGGTVGSLTDYNFADRDCTAKDLYSNSNYIFAQGGNYIVPYGVTAINIEANFANAFYLSDAYYDYGYDATYGGQTGLTTQVPTTYHGRTVYTDLNTLLSAMSSNVTDPHKQAIVLVGNYHYNQNTIGGNIFGNNTTKGLTIMSVDEDCNQEPDYGWYSYHSSTDRTDIPPMRFDFVPNIGIGMAARTTGSTPYPTIGIWHSHGWFELTETCVSIMSECEINSYSFDAADNGKGNNRWIVNSGYFIQIVRARDGNCTKLSYIQIGGNAYVEQLYPGSHTDNARNVTICPIVVTGGEIEDCFMTGYKAGATATGQNINFWCAGGKIHKYLSAYMEQPNSDVVNVTAKVDHARIRRFFGGGTSASARITGNIDITMNNSLVDFYCGGPEFGDMASGKTVTTNTIGTTFGQYYGAGYGGTSITYNREQQSSGVGFANDTSEYPLGWGNFKRLTENQNYGIGTCYDFEYILYAGGTGSGVARFYTGYAQFSLAQTGSVTNTLQNCTIEGDFYGGGCQGTVDGSVSSTLTNCTLMGGAFGGGYKASANEVKVYPDRQPPYSTYTRETGIFSDFGTIEPEIYTWEYRNNAGSDQNRKILYTTTDMSQLGNVTGAITLNINGGSVAKNVFGGGNESPSRDNTTVTISDNAIVGTNVYGGGNVATVDGSSVVNMNQGSVFGAVFGGGNQAGIGSNATVSVAGGIIASGVYGGSNASGAVGNTIVTLTNGIIGTDAAHANVHGGGYGKDTQVFGNVAVNIQGGTVYGDVYGGSALGTVNTDTDNTTIVNLTGGIIHGDAYGGGLGDSETAADVNGNVTVTLDGTAFTLATTKDDDDNTIPTSGRVFGCNNINGSPKGTVLVKVLSTVAKNGDGTSKDKPEKDSGIYELQAVYGGGNLAAYNPTNPKATGQFTSYKLGENTVSYENTAKPVQVVIDGCDLTSIEYVYGGGNAAATPATDVLVLGSYEIGNVFGGGNGKDRYTLDGGTTWNENLGADVGIIDAVAYAADHTQGLYGTGKSKASVLGGTVHNLFGASNTKGNVVSESLAYVDNANICDLNVGGIYGGGNEAYMDGDSKIELGCIEAMEEIYGGARNADVKGDIKLTISSGHFDRVFGGNNIGGTINGSITVTIEETGCNPITIGELYGCGNQAPYTTPEGEDHPTINLISFTSIGNVFGGGFGEKAVVKGNPTVNINVTSIGANANRENWSYNGSTIDFGSEYIVQLPVHEKGKIGVIGTVYGGGNAAKVIGNTTVNMKNGIVENTLFGGGNAADVEGSTSVTILDGTIGGNVYGGGNQGNVAGATKVQIGEQPTP